MSRHDVPGGDDNLLRLWQETRLAAPDPERLARSVGRIALLGFDRRLRVQDLREYVGFLLIFAFFTVQWVIGGAAFNWIQAALAIGGALFVISYLFWRHRRLLTPLDPSASGRAYHAALLARIDGQLQLVKSLRYWYLLPLYPPVLWTVASTWERNRAAAAAGFVVMTAAYVAVAWLSARYEVRRLTAQRRELESLYTEASS
jgi:hypothetical protein